MTDWMIPFAVLLGMAAYLSVGTAINGAFRLSGNDALWVAVSWPLYIAIGAVLAPFALPIGAWWLAGKARDAIDKRKLSRLSSRAKDQSQ